MTPGIVVHIAEKGGGDKMNRYRSRRRHGTTAHGSRKSAPLIEQLVTWLIQKLIVDSIERVGVTLSDKVVIPTLEKIRKRRKGR